MNIEKDSTKYSLGDEVWFSRYSNNFKGIIIETSYRITHTSFKGNVIEEKEVMYLVESNNKDAEYFYEDELFPTEEELIKNQEQYE